MMLVVVVGRVCFWFVCVSVFPRASYLRNYKSDLYLTFQACYTRPCLGPSPSALRYVMYFRFYGWRDEVDGRGTAVIWRVEQARAAEQHCSQLLLPADLSILCSGPAHISPP